jgi:hypothetical protein
MWGTQFLCAGVSGAFQYPIDRRSAHREDLSEVGDRVLLALVLGDQLGLLAGAELGLSERPAASSTPRPDGNKRAGYFTTTPSNPKIALGCSFSCTPNGPQPSAASP